MLVHSLRTSAYIMILHNPETNSVQKNHNVTNIKEVNDWFTDDNSNNRISPSEQNETERIKSSVNNLLISYQLWVILVASSRKSKNSNLFLIFYSTYSPNVSFHRLFSSFTRYRNVKRVLNFWLLCSEQIRSHAHMCTNT